MKTIRNSVRSEKNLRRMDFPLCFSLSSTKASAVREWVFIRVLPISRKRGHESCLRVLCRACAKRFVGLFVLGIFFAWQKPIRQLKEGFFLTEVRGHFKRPSCACFPFFIERLSRKESGTRLCQLCSTQRPAHTGLWTVYLNNHWECRLCRTLKRDSCSDFLYLFRFCWNIFFVHSTITLNRAAPQEQPKRGLKKHPFKVAFVVKWRYKFAGQRRSWCVRNPDNVKW